MIWSKKIIEKINKLNKALIRLEKRVVELETKWKYDYLDEITLIAEDASWEGYTKEDSFIIIDKKIEYQDAYDDDGYYTKYYRVIVNKGECITTIGKGTLEENFKLKK